MQAKSDCITNCSTPQIPQPKFSIGQKVITSDCTFGDRVGYIRAYIEGEDWPYAVAFGFKNGRHGDIEWSEYGFKESELIDASDGQLMLFGGGES